MAHLATAALGRALALAGEPDAAVAELQQADARLRAVWRAPVAGRAEQELRRLGHRVHRRSQPATSSNGGAAGGAGGSAALSGRELEVARLVVDRSARGF